MNSSNNNKSRRHGRKGWLYTARGRKHVLIFVFVAILWIIFSSLQSFVPIAFAILSQTCISTCLIILSLRLADLFKSPLLPDSSVDPVDKAVLVTGCSSGFGFQLVQRLDSLGFKVFAACRIVDDDRAKRLVNSCSSNVSLIRMDVTKEDEVTAAVETISKQLGNQNLWSVVCNAGVFLTSGFDWGSDGVAEYQRLMDTNAFGVVRVAKSFTPLLRQTRNSRIILTSSTAGFLPCPSLAAYSMSKHALRGFGKALRIELMPFDVHVSMVEPDFYGTPLIADDKVSQQLEQTWDTTPAVVRDSYSIRQKDSVIRTARSLLSVCHEDITDVVDALTTAVTTDRQPDHYYRICSFVESISFYANEILPSELVEDYWTGPLVVLVCKALIAGNRLTDRITGMFGSRCRRRKPLQ